MSEIGERIKALETDFENLKDKVACNTDDIDEIKRNQNNMLVNINNVSDKLDVLINARKERSELKVLRLNIGIMVMAVVVSLGGLYFTYKQTQILEQQFMEMKEEKQSDHRKSSLLELNQFAKNYNVLERKSYGRTE